MKEELEEVQNFISGALDRFEGKLAVIKLEDGQEFTWPINNLPQDVAEGSNLRLILSSSQTDELEREKIAKSLLNVILQKN